MESNERNYIEYKELCNDYVDIFSNLTSTNAISSEFNTIAKSYTGIQQNIILAMMLEYAIIGGRVDIIEHVLDLGANPNFICKQNYIHELLNDTGIDKKTIIQMEYAINRRGYNINLTIYNGDIFNT